MNELDPEILAELKALRGAVEALPGAIVAAIVKDLIVQDDSPQVSGDCCEHPLEQRVELGDGEWECGVRTCRYRHSAEVASVPA